jgi:acrylyl-CoA reductase (NADPH)
MSFTALRLFQEDGMRRSRYVPQQLADLDPGDVVIATRYAAVNYKDARAVSGAGNVIKRFPCVPGIEMSGEVLSSSSSRFRPGDLVTVQGGANFGIRHDGAYSEQVRVPAEWVAPIPVGFDPWDVVALGIAAYTSALAVEALIAHGLRPEDGPIAVTGATGGCASFAIDMLAGLGYTVVASTGKTRAQDYLDRIGASDVVGRDGLCSGTRPLEDQRWAGAIDSVGGAPLDQLLRSMKKRGIVCAFGNAAGETFQSSIYPFILRSITLAGINGNHPVAERGSAWERMAVGGDLRPHHLRDIVFEIGFAELKDYCEKVIAGGIQGRALVRF